MPSAGRENFAPVIREAIGTGRWAGSQTNFMVPAVCRVDPFLMWSRAETIGGTNCPELLPSLILTHTRLIDGDAFHLS